jgi:mannosyl-glycoprotein endo-beta-N-acetylglucosaminidase
MPRRSRARLPRRAAVLAVLLGAVLSGALGPAVGSGSAAFAQETTTTTTPPGTTTPPSTTTAPSTTTPTSTSPAPTRVTTGPAATPTTTPHPDPDAFAALANQVSTNQALLAQLTAQVDQTTQRLADLGVAIADTQQKLDAARAEMTRLQQIVRSRASYIYTHAGAPQTAVVDIQHVEDITAGKKYAETATRTDSARIGDLERLSTTLDTHRRELEAERTEQQQQKDRLQAAKAGLEAVTARQKKLLDEVGAIPVMGDAELTAANLTDWFNAREAHYRLAGGMQIADLIQLYMDEGKAEHVRPELAFAQAIIETGSFGHALDSNYAGIGACDSCQGEPSFPTPRDGVRGQIQLLRNYADPTSRAANLANPPSPTIYGTDPVAAAQSYDTFFAKGVAPTWNAMGNGNWATDPGYAQKVLTVYFQMVSFAAQHS